MAYKIVSVKYCGPTNTRGSRWRVSHRDCPSTYVAYDHSVSPSDNARAAAQNWINRINPWQFCNSEIVGLAEDGSDRYQVIVKLS